MSINIDNDYPSTYTKNLNLEKQPQEQFYNVDVFNNNFDKIDGAIVSVASPNKLLKLNADGKLPTSVTGNAATATKLQTMRKINGVNFDGSTDITIADDTKSPTTHTHNYAGSDTAGGVATSAKYCCVVNNNEIRFDKYDASIADGTINIGHRWSDRSTSPTVKYKFCNGDGAGTKADIYAANFFGDLKGDADTVDGLHESAFMRVGTVNISSSDWNTITRAGCYDVASATPLTESLHQPVGAYSYGVLLVSKGALNTGISQLYLAHNNNEIWCRAGYANNAWQPWQKLFYNGIAQRSYSLKWKGREEFLETDWNYVTGNLTHLLGFQDGDKSTAYVIDPAKLPLVSTTANGLCPQRTGVATTYLNGQGGWTTPPNTVYTHPSSHPVSMITGLTDFVANQFTGNFAQNGWRKTPDGLIVQWGVATTNPKVTFPISFNTCFIVNASMMDTAGRTRNNGAYDVTNLGFEAFREGTDKIAWIAIGV